jgi:hypothetical protein
MVCACPCLLESQLARVKLGGTCGRFPARRLPPSLTTSRARSHTTASRPFPRHFTTTASANPPRNTANMSDDEERVTMPFKFVTGASYELVPATT